MPHDHISGNTAKYAITKESAGITVSLLKNEIPTSETE
jgi:hypothetical protein